MGSHTRNVLTVKSIAASKAAKLRDGGGLWLVSKGQGRYWIFDFRFGGKRRELGLGPLHTVGLAEARQKAEAARLLVRQGVDPIEHRHGVEAIEAAQARACVKTFGQYADAYVDDAVKAGRWRGGKTEARWRNMLTNHAKAIRDKALASIGVTEVLSVLRPLWGDKQETAEKLRECIERVLDAAKVEGLRAGENPAAWKGNLEHVLHKPDALTTKSNHAAMPWARVPVLTTTLAALETIGARALEFTILNAARSGEVRGASWPEFDLAGKLWTIPAERMKGGKLHRVPLSDRAVTILEEMREKRSNDFVFPGVRAKRPMSENTMAKVLAENGGNGFTVHGFRSTFRDWVTEATAHDGDLAEMALAHAVGDAVARAYARSDALEKRRLLMANWAEYCGSCPKENKLEPAD
ncbi:tyrosine-type recombinase/integrase [Aminobacter niigataensis]|uniref:tyrosine-type recombinase/integrase n=1 Tax=Aminobacter niigataensis TaxID=83265 RepID=UPI0024C704E0|nr:site-specific integrase [Aminobacter niigataensis]CAI2935044.1 Phage integrase family protein [Aminobacter niigataensis]